MARIDQRWLNFSARGAAWWHFWGDAPAQAGTGTTGEASLTLGGVTVAGAAGVAIAGAGEVAAGPVGLSSAGQVAIAGAASLSMAGVTVEATGTTEAAEDGEPSIWLAGRVAGKVAARLAARRLAA